jgi:hypothetical protein
VNMKNAEKSQLPVPDKRCRLESGPKRVRGKKPHSDQRGGSDPLAESLRESGANPYSPRMVKEFSLPEALRCNRSREM